MKILIAYASKSGTARELCTLLASLLPNHEVSVADLATEQPSPQDFDYVVLGSPVRFGKLHRAVKMYIKEHGRAIAAVPHTLFLCCAFADQFENYAEMLYKRVLLESADEVVYFGGELDPTKQRGIEKLFVRMMRSAIRDSEDNEAVLPGPRPEHVRLLADRLKLLSVHKS